MEEGGAGQVGQDARRTPPSLVKPKAALPDKAPSNTQQELSGTILEMILTTCS